MNGLAILRAPILLLIFALIACNPEAMQGPTTWIDRPLDGDQVALEPLTIQAHASDAAGVTRFEFLIESLLLASVPGSGTRFAEAKAGWVPPAPGTYTLHVRATNGKGDVGADATARIVVGALATTTPTPVPAAIGTTTPTPAPAAIVTITPSPVPAAIVTITPSPVPAACPGPPVITSFTANPTAITYGQTILFSWGAITNADDAIIDAVGHIALQGGSWPLQPPPVAATYPTKTTTFTLTATGCGGTTTKQVTVVVNPAPPPPPTRTLPPPPTLTPPPPPDTTPPSISNVSANPTSISKPGCGQTTRTTVSATVTDAGGVNRVVARVLGTGIEVALNPVGGNVYQGTLGPFDSTGTFSVIIQAWDRAGNQAQSGSINVPVVCIQ